MQQATFEGFPEKGIRFLRSLKRNNRRVWFQKRKDTYLEDVKAPMEDFILVVADAFRRFAPEMVANPKVSAYRIYRDTRFSKDKSPYKTHVAAVFPRRDLAKHEGAGFYVHVAPDEVFVGGGLYMPDKQGLQAVREHLARNHRQFRSKVGSRRFRSFFNEISGEQLSRVPRGFLADHPAADLLRYKQFLATRQLEPQLATSPAFYPEVIQTFKALLPMIRFLNEPIVGQHSSGLDLTDQPRGREQPVVELCRVARRGLRV